MRLIVVIILKPGFNKGLRPESATERDHRDKEAQTTPDHHGIASKKDPSPGVVHARPLGDAFCFSGRPACPTVDAVARNHRPDHLAILPDQVGACSLADGAGLIRNAWEDNVMLLPPQWCNA